MTTSTIVWIVVAVAALLIIGAIVALGAAAGAGKPGLTASASRFSKTPQRWNAVKRSARDRRAGAGRTGGGRSKGGRSCAAAGARRHHQSEAAASREHVNAKAQQADQLDPRGREAEDPGQHEQPHRESHRSHVEQTSETTPGAAEDRSTATTHDATT